VCAESGEGESVPGKKKESVDTIRVWLLISSVLCLETKKCAMVTFSETKLGGGEEVKLERETSIFLSAITVLNF